MKIPVQLKHAPSNDKNWQALQQTYQQVAKTVNGSVNMVPVDAPALSLTNTPLPADNIAAAHAVYVTGTPGTDDVVTHNLARVPYGFHLVAKNASVDVYNSPTPNTPTKIFLRSTVAGVTVKVMVY